jgi:hypothetical protein
MMGISFATPVQLSCAEVADLQPFAAICIRLRGLRQSPIFLMQSERLLYARLTAINFDAMQRNMRCK